MGAGYWGSNHIKTLIELEALKGVVEPNIGLLESLSSENHDIKIHSTIENALMENYDGFTIATPAETHYEIAKKIISHGKHALIEKPMTLSIKEAESLVSIAEQKKVNVMVGHVLLFHPAFMKISETIESGRLGDIQYIYSNRTNLGVVRTHENVFWSLAPHDISLFQYFIKDEPNPQNLYFSQENSGFLYDGNAPATQQQRTRTAARKDNSALAEHLQNKNPSLVALGKKGPEGSLGVPKESVGKPLLFNAKIALKKALKRKEMKRSEISLSLLFCFLRKKQLVWKP